MPVERRSINIKAGELELRASNDSLPVIQGYTAVFDQEIEINSFFGGFKETIRAGAFKRALKESQDVRALFNHDPNNIFARSTNGTLFMKEDSKGLYIEAQPADTVLGRDLVTLVERGDVSGMSFAFTIRRVIWEENNDEDELDRREILEIDQLYDVGPVVYPAYDETTAEASRSIDWDSIKNERDNYARGHIITYGTGTTTREGELPAATNNTTTGNTIWAPNVTLTPPFKLKRGEDEELIFQFEPVDNDCEESRDDIERKQRERGREIDLIELQK